jgi:DNA-binding IclR family transcriptional regulator
LTASRIPPRIDDPTTATTITDRTALNAEIALTRARGYELNEGEMEAGVGCVAGIYISLTPTG